MVAKIVMPKHSKKAASFIFILVTSFYYDLLVSYTLLCAVGCGRSLDAQFFRFAHHSGLQTGDWWPTEC